MGKYKDRDLGMAQPISRRDILHGLGATAASSFVPGIALADEVLAASAMPGTNDDEREEYMHSISYRTFLEEHLDIHEPEVFAILQDLPLDWGVGIEAIAAGEAIGYLGLPGAKAAGFDDYEDDEPYIHHFPDGNASVARMLVRKMIPAVAPARDIAGITVNRWAHGYADGSNDFGSEWLGDRNDERRPHVRGRKPFGRITIANSDAGGSAMLESAVGQAHRAVEELR